MATGSRTYGGDSGISMYLDPPVCEITMESFRLCAYDRLKLLKTMEGASELGSREKKKIMRRNLKELSLEGEKDIRSHYILRFALCRTDWHRKWLIERERALLELKFTTCSELERDSFIQASMRQCTSRDKSQRIERILPDQLFKEIGIHSKFYRERKLFYKVPFERVTTLLRKKNVVLKNGYAYVPTSLMFGFLKQWFTERLRKHLQVLSRICSGVRKDRRVEEMLEGFLVQVTKPVTYQPPKNRAAGEITHRDIACMSSESFPPCMLEMYRNLNKDSHLKYWGRRTFGLFLKGIGLSLEESLRFWKLSFSRRFTVVEWQRNYAYNIRHNYGKEGKCADYAPYDCQRVISQIQGVGEYHSCPFKYCDSANLRIILERYSIAEELIPKIQKLASSSKYKKACQQFFLGKHPKAFSIPGVEMKEVGVHPNVYYDQSRVYYNTGIVSGDGSSDSDSAYSMDYV
ncbi:hypothetical protein AAMO2058_000076200 [Amorphochlora amoebiformis]